MSSDCDYTTDGSVVVSEMSEEWEEKMLEKIANMFRDMGMAMDLEQLRGLMNQFRSQFKAMGIDEEKIKSGDVNFNLDFQNIMKLFQTNVPMDKVLSNLGVDLKVDAAPVEVDAEVEFSDDNELLKPPADDIYLDGWNIRFYGNLRDQLENLNEYQLRVTLAILDDYGLLDSLDLRDLHDLFGIQIVGILDRFEFSRQDMNDLLDLLELHDMFMLLDSSGYLKSLDVDDSYLLDLWDKIDERDLLGGRDASSDSEASVMSEDLRKTLDLVWEETFFDRDLRDFLDQMDSLDYRDRSAVPENGELIGLLYQSDDWDLVALLAWRDMVDDFDFNHSLDIDFDNLYSLFSECKYEGTLTD